MAISTIKLTPVYALELHDFKALFLARQYRQCIAACEKQLSSLGQSNDPLILAFLDFYAASSHDSIAVLMHDFSSSRLSRIESAETHYLRAIHAVSECYIAVEAHPESVSAGDHRVNSPQESSPDLRTAYRQRTTVERDHLPPYAQHANTEDGRSTPTHGRFARNFSRPLARTTRHHQLNNPESRSPTLNRSMSLMDLGPGQNLQNVKGFFSPIKEESDEATMAQIPPPTPPETPLSSPSFEEDLTPTVSRKRAPYSLRQNVTSTDQPTSPESMHESEYSFKVKTFNNNAQAFVIQLQAHLDKLRELKVKTEAAQAERSAKRSARNAGIDSRVMQSSRSYWSFDNTHVGTPGKKKRLEEGRSRQWKRERVDVGKYQRLAETAMAELGIS
ncbi:hypothetical protein MBLNU457_3105t1 [Dothideomycetes sp. NU457]